MLVLWCGLWSLMPDVGNMKGEEQLHIQRRGGLRLLVIELKTLFFRTLLSGLALLGVVI